jgi:two-component system chemotaxis sensor kinase CheA
MAAMSTQDDEFMARLRATFHAEAQELLQTISSILLELEKLPASSPPSPPAAILIENVFREAHTLKGAARAVDLPEIEAICQQVESVFSSWKKQQSIPTAEAFDSLHHAVDMMRALLPSSVAGSDKHAQQTTELIRRLGDLQSQPPPPAGPVEPVMAAPPAAPSQPPVDAERTAAAETVRISIDQLDSRLLQTEDMLVLKTITAQRADELRQMTLRLEQWQREWAKVSSEARTLRQALEQHGKSAIEPSAALVNFLDWNCEFVRSVENKLISLASQTQQDHHDVGKRVDNLLESSKKLLMLPFSTLANQFPRLVRDLCRDQNKEADFVIRGGELEIDKRVLDEMKDAMIHILRNCIDHGVETPAQRELLHKPARATITIAASPVNGNKVEILVTDDGAGVDLQRVKESAVSHGILSEPDARVLADADALKLIFHSEVTASPIVTTISGRGLGMAIVHAKTEKLGGKVLIESQRNIGTTLRMILPLTLATFRGILITVADRIFVVPAIHVERVLRVKSQDIKTVENRDVISLQGRAVSLARLHAILDLPAKSDARGASESLSVVVLHSADQRVAFVVDEVLREEEVLVKPLRKPLVRVRNIGGATVLGSGKVAPVLNVIDLLKSARNIGAAAIPGVASDKSSETSSKKILVVEDSITSRMLLKGILEAAGYQVKTAVDGVDGFTALREDQFDLVVSDVEMPRMNGFDLTARIRSDKRLGELPVVLITALESREQRERGIDAGANAYVIKSSFDQQNLLDVVRRLT